MEVEDIFWRIFICVCHQYVSKKLGVCCSISNGGADLLFRTNTMGYSLLFLTSTLITFFFFIYLTVNLNSFPYFDFPSMLQQLQLSKSDIGILGSFFSFSFSVSKFFGGVAADYWNPVHLIWYTDSSSLVFVFCISSLSLLSIVLSALCVLCLSFSSLLFVLLLLSVLCAPLLSDPYLFLCFHYSASDPSILLSPAFLSLVSLLSIAYH